MSEEPISPVQRLRRWEEAGAVWCIVGRRRDAVTIALCRCDGGEEADRIESADPQLLAYVGDRESNADG